MTNQSPDRKGAGLSRDSGFATRDSGLPAHSNKLEWGTRRTWLARGVLAALLLALLSVWMLRGTPATVIAAEPSDIAAVADAIERLPVVGSVLLTGAHPDDENNALLAYLARGLHVRTAYLSATRGDGGQNLLGNEQYEALGILRTEELMAARRLDGAEQFFANAYDFGFSKSQEETFQKWGKENVLRDFVRVIRQFRPDIIISRFTGTPADGHGHHQAAGTLTREAFDAAADPARFPELAQEGLQPWQARWLFINRGGGGGGGQGVGADGFTITLGGYSPIYGEEYGDLGAEARSQHRSQGMGQSGGRGPYTTSFRFWAAAPGVTGTPKSLFEGIDLTLNRFAALVQYHPAASSRVSEIENAIAEARSNLRPNEPARAAAPLLQAFLSFQVLQRMFLTQHEDWAQQWLVRKEREFAEAIAKTSAVTLDARASVDEVVTGGAIQVTVSGVVPSPFQAGRVVLTGPPGWEIKSLGEPAAIAQSERVEARFEVTVPTGAELSQPYWLAGDRSGDYFNVAELSYAGEPHQPPQLRATLWIDASGAPNTARLSISRDVVYRFTDRIYGERERPVAVVPALGVWLEPSVAVFRQGQNGAKRMFLARVLNNTGTEQKGTLRLHLPDGYRANPASASFTLAKKGDEFSARFEVTPAPPAPPLPRPRTGLTTASMYFDPSAFYPAAIAEAGGQQYATGYQVIDYPHVNTRYWFREARADLKQIDVKVAQGLRVGYIMGSGDEVPAALKQLGLGVTPLTEEDLAFGDLSRFNVIVTGIRAYEVRKDISANHARLMEWVKNGGVMIVQYSRTGGISVPLGPYPLDLGSQPRVSVEEAPVEILDPAHPIFNSPNRITAADFDGWVQERGTYFMSTWAPEYTPLLASNDPGEPSQKGGMLLARHGNGYYLYTGYVWFRQLPAGVPGAYRIFANMLSLGKQ